MVMMHYVMPSVMYKRLLVLPYAAWQGVRAASHKEVQLGACFAQKPQGRRACLA